MRRCGLRRINENGTEKADIAVGFFCRIVYLNKRNNYKIGYLDKLFYLVFGYCNKFLCIFAAE